MCVVECATSACAPFFVFLRYNKTCCQSVAVLSELINYFSFFLFVAFVVVSLYKKSLISKEGRKCFDL